MSLAIPQNLFRHMIELAEKGLPNEICGLLGGADDEIKSIHPIENIDHSRESYAMAPAEQFAAIKQMRADGLKFRAIYHSHPETPSRPSVADIAQAFQPDVSYLIISLAEPGNPTIKSFRIVDGVVSEEPISILETQAS